MFLCIVNNIRDGKSCTIEDMDRILHIGKRNIINAIKNLQEAQCIDVIQNRSVKGNWYNVYSQKYTDIYDDKTYNDQKTKGTVQKKVIEMDKRNKEEEDGITIKLMA